MPARSRAGEVKAKLLGTISEMGKSQAIVECDACGWRNYFYIWSWAGHSKARCKGCRRWISHRTLEVSEGK